LISFDADGASLRRRLATAAAQTFAWALAEKADFGMPPAMDASPVTWMLGCSRDSKVTGSIGHHPLRSATPAACAIQPARCGGITFATCALCRPNSVTSVISRASTSVTLPPEDSGTHSMRPG
jgi:hypothetical protein